MERRQAEIVPPGGISKGAGTELEVVRTQAALTGHGSGASSLPLALIDRLGTIGLQATAASTAARGCHTFLIARKKCSHVFLECFFTCTPNTPPCGKNMAHMAVHVLPKMINLQSLGLGSSG